MGSVPAQELGSAIRSVCGDRILAEAGEIFLGKCIENNRVVYESQPYEPKHKVYVDRQIYIKRNFPRSLCNLF